MVCGYCPSPLIRGNPPKQRVQAFVVECVVVEFWAIRPDVL